MNTVTFINANNTQYTIDTTNTKSKEEIQKVNEKILEQKVLLEQLTKNNKLNVIENLNENKIKD